MKKINIGCGFKFDKSKHPLAQHTLDDLSWHTNGEGFIGIDSGDYGQHIVRDVRRGLPFDDESIDEILADNFLEHIPIQEHFGENDFAFVMNEALRVLKPGGLMKIIVPYFSDRAAYKDPTHCRFFTEDTFTYLEKENAWEYGFKKGWKIKQCVRPENRNSILIVILQKENI